MTTTASQAWAILKRHARDEISPLRLQDLCQDNDRVSSLVAVHNSTPLRGADGQPTCHNGMLLVDLSRQRMTLETLNHLLHLSVARGLRKYITRLAWGQNNPDTPLQITTHKSSARHSSRRRAEKQTNPENQSGNAAPFDASVAEGGADFPHVMPSMHLALRAPKDQGLHMLTVDGVNALTAIHREWDRIERLSDSIRRGNWRGVSGQMIRDVVVVGCGVAIQALKFVDKALCHDETAIMARKFGMDVYYSGLTDWSGATSRLLRRGLAGTGTGGSAPAHASVRPRKIHFLTSVDPLAAASLVAELDAESTMVISFSLQGNEETGLATQTMKTWLLQQLDGGKASGQSLSTTSKRADIILSKHMLLVTGNDQIATSINKPASLFIVPEHSRCEAFISFSAVTLLPMSIVYGWSICEKFLAGGHDMDCHFVETNPRHNLPVLLALTDVWNDAFLAPSSGRVVTPFTQSMNGFPSFVASLEAQTCSGNNPANRNPSRISCSALVLDGGSDGAYDRALYLSPKIHCSELIMVMNTQLKANTSRNLGLQGMDDVFQRADALMCSLFGHADELAFGSLEEAHYGHFATVDAGGLQSVEFSLQEHQRHTQLTGAGGSANSPRFANPSPQSHNSHSDGNRPSTLLICGTLDAFACGQLIALSEHRAAVKARIWDIDPFTGGAGYTMRTPRAEQLRQDLEKIYIVKEMGGGGDSDEENDESGGLNLSSKTIMGHYAGVRT